MTDGFGYYTGDQGQEAADDLNLQQQQGQQQGQPQQGGNGLRQYIASLEAKTEEQGKLLQQLVKDSQRNKVADTLEAKGYDRGAAALYNGDPEKVDEWLNAAGSLLAKRPNPEGQGGGAGAGQPNTTVDQNGQAQLQAFQQAGQQGAPPQGSDKEQAAVIAAFDDPEKMNAYLAAQGNQFAKYWEG